MTREELIVSQAMKIAELEEKLKDEKESSMRWYDKYAELKSKADESKIIGEQPVERF